MEVKTLVRPRVLSSDQADALVGDPVEDLPGTIDGATIIVDAASGKIMLAYLPLPDIAPLRRAVMSFHYSERMVRGNGRRNMARTFGYGPRRPVYRREGCSTSRLERESPDAHNAVIAYATKLSQVLEEAAPGVVQKARETMEEVASDWKMGESELWTSGVINQSSRLPYHRDAMNFPVWSAMPVLRRHMRGGHLSIPEYDVVVPCRDGWGLFFPGYELVHGVTPMTPTASDGYRYSLVYYALRGMQDCFTYAAEQEYAKRRRTEREQHIASELAAGATPIALSGKGMPLGRTGAYAREMPGYLDQGRAVAERYAELAAAEKQDDPE